MRGNVAITGDEHAMIGPIRMGVGLGMLLTPFAILTYIMYAAGGLIAVLSIWGGCGAIVACILGGIHLLQPR